MYVLLVNGCGGELVVVVVYMYSDIIIHHIYLSDVTDRMLYCTLVECASIMHGYLGIYVIINTQLVFPSVNELARFLSNPRFLSFLRYSIVYEEFPRLLDHFYVYYFLQ